MLVYREAAERFATSELLAALRAAFRLLESEPHNNHAAVAALVRAGELECALADLRSDAARFAERLTDAAAGYLCGAPIETAAARVLETLGRANLPANLSIRPFEGFAYYALHPLQYAAMAGDFPGTRPECRCAAIVGIRSIGTALSAVVAAALRAHGVACDRITLRPTGHPYSRELHLSNAEASWLEARRQAGAEFLVVDEGPGRSGSSFLATAEALEACGIEAERISLLCSHAPDPASLVAEDAANRWLRFRAFSPAPDSRLLPRDADLDLSGGAWRSFFYSDSAAWPSSWRSTERLKFISACGQSLLKFEGLGRYGESVLQRSSLVAGAGFGPSCECDLAGFVRCNMVAGRPAVGELDRETLHRLADYCAFRVRQFASPNSDVTELQRMASFNLQQILGVPLDVTLPIIHSVIADSRMMPHEWLRTPSGLLMKTDAASHGNDHFYPGPTDIAWDLAGAIVEWRMSPAAAAEFVVNYAAQSGDDASTRISQYTAAYLAFRIGFLDMASQSAADGERSRLERDANAYRSLLDGIVSQPRAQSA